MRDGAGRHPTPVYYLTQTGLITLENTITWPAAPSSRRTRRRRSAAWLASGESDSSGRGRIFNASVALSVEAADLARPFDSVMTCLSKGLGAPVGSVVAGPDHFIQEALRVRKRLGGGMRQAGVLAAAGLVALRDNVARLAEDHANARLLAERVAGLDGLRIDPRSVQTNIVIFAVELDGFTAHDLASRWKEEGVLALAIDDARVRAVTHYDVDRRQVDTACDGLARILTGARRARQEKGTGP